MKLSTKLMLPVLAVGLIASSAFAGKRPRLVEPSLGILGVISVLNVVAGVASYAAIDRLFPENETILSPLCKILAVGYWISNECEVIQKYQSEKAQWELVQAVNKLLNYKSKIVKKTKAA